jgi:hypothetical protein
MQASAKTDHGAAARAGRYPCRGARAGPATLLECPGCEPRSIDKRCFVGEAMYATCNARSLMHFLSLRTTHHQAAVPSFPQREIEMVAEQMEALWAKLMPLTHQAYNGHGRRAP